MKRPGPLLLYPHVAVIQACHESPRKGNRPRHDGLTVAFALDKHNSTTASMSISASTSSTTTGAQNGAADEAATKQRGEAELKALLARETGECLTVSSVVQQQQQRQRNRH